MLPNEPASPEIQKLLAYLAKQYPALAGIANRVNIQVGNPRSRTRLEFYQRGENDSPTPTRPTLLAFGNVKPIDVAGDLVSHFAARGVDRKLTGYYNQFRNSMTPQQNKTLREQYRWAKRNAGETRSFAKWARVSGVPAYFRGYAFGQWPQDQIPQLYTPEQMQMFDQMNAYLRGGS